ncbi:hypothetical protein [Actinomadura chibensis]|uniref:Nuclear transport factor 2 family protein n=1 Tax=Actinomadura chibensis TaxID=392828 RepID=A0A5D0NQN9_9ACTN|nr:hypothetical protein [Actinomadura chibensis]TYB46612.1 hypothetical protein FXF69_15455 [Actinomadura chibensis]
MRARLVLPPRLGSHRADRLPAVLALCALAVAGCGSSHSGSGGELAPNGSFDTGAAPSQAAAAPSAIPTERLFKTALKRYREFQAAYKKAYETNDPTALSAVAMDPLLSEVTRDVEATKAKGEIWRFTNTLNPRVYARATDNTKVYVIDCVRTLAAYRFSATTGKRTGELPGGTYAYRATVQYDSGVWKVAANVKDRPC